MTATAAATDRQNAVDLGERWTRMWNGELDLAHTILTPDFAIEFGAVIIDPDPAAINDPASMAAFVAAWRARHGNLVFALQRPPVVDAGGVAFVWSVHRDSGESRSGIDLCELEANRIRRVWSVTGDRLLGSS